MRIIWILSDLRNKLHQIERKNRKKYQIDKRSYLGPRLLRSRFGLYWSCISFFHKLQQLKLQNYFRTCSCHRLSDKRPSTAIKTKFKHYFYWINFIKTKLGKILTPNRAHHHLFNIYIHTHIKTKSLEQITQEKQRYAPRWAAIVVRRETRFANSTPWSMKGREKHDKFTCKLIATPTLVIGERLFKSKEIAIRTRKTQNETKEKRERKKNEKNLQECDVVLARCRIITC